MDGITKDLDDLVSLYEIVSEQMNPFVGLSKVTKKRIDALENFTAEIEEVKGRMGDLEIMFEQGVGGIKKIKDKINTNRIERSSKIQDDLENIQKDLEKKDDELSKNQEKDTKNDEDSNKETTNEKNEEQESDLIKTDKKEENKIEQKPDKIINKDFEKVDNEILNDDNMNKDADEENNDEIFSVKYEEDYFDEINELSDQELDNIINTSFNSERLSSIDNIINEFLLNLK